MISEPSTNPCGHDELPVLVVEARPAAARALSRALARSGLDCRIAGEPVAALAALAREPFGAVLQDLDGAPQDRHGSDLFRAIHRARPHLPVVLLAPWTAHEVAVRLVREGACDVVGKPWDEERLVATVRRLIAREPGSRRMPLATARAELDARVDLRGAAWGSASFHELVLLALRIAPANAPVLIVGPPGSGKEKLAEIVQANSPRRDRPFLRVNARALSAELLDAELFGCAERSGPEPAPRRPGRLEAADGGTLLLDDVARLSPAGQRRLLRLLRTGELEIAGGAAVPVDVRLLATAEPGLDAEIAAGRFRAELRQRLAVAELSVPPLAERREDILPLARRILAGMPVRAGGPWRLSEEAETALLARDWAGNAGDLRCLLRRATQGAATPLLGARALGLEPPPPSPEISSAPRLRLGSSGAPGRGAERALDERRALERALSEARGVVAHAAQALGISRQALYRRLARHGLAAEPRLSG